MKSISPILVAISLTSSLTVFAGPPKSYRAKGTFTPDSVETKVIGKDLEEVRERKTYISAQPEVDGYSQKEVERRYTRGTGQYTQGGYDTTTTTTYRAAQQPPQKKIQVERPDIVFARSSLFKAWNYTYLLDKFVDKGDFSKENNTVAILEQNSLQVATNFWEYGLSEKQLRGIIESKACQKRTTGPCLIVSNIDLAFALLVEYSIGDGVTTVSVANVTEESLKDDEFANEYSFIAKEKSHNTLEEVKNYAYALNKEKPVLFTQAFTKKSLDKKVEAYGRGLNVPIEDRNPYRGH